MKLHEKYGDVVPRHGPIPAHLLGNIWAQDWSNVYPLVAPADADAGFSLTDILKRRTMRPIDMVRTGERFYTSLGIRAAAADVLGALALRAAEGSRGRLPRQRVGHRPRDRRPHQDVHRADRRGLHDDPPRARAQLLPARLQDICRCSSATAPTTASTRRSATPSRCRSRRSTWCRIGLLDKAPDASRDIGLLLARALEKIAFLPFGLLDRPVALEGVRRRGDAGRLQQGVVGSAAEVPGRGAAGGARRGVLRSRREVPRAGQHAVHALLPRGHPAVPVPSRAVEDRRLHHAAAPLLDLRAARKRVGGCRRCSMGLSQPWPDALEALTGTREMDASAILDYFAPLQGGSRSRRRASRWAGEESDELAISLRKIPPHRDISAWRRQRRARVVSWRRRAGTGTRLA